MRARGVQVSMQSVLKWRTIMGGKARQPHPNTRKLVVDVLNAIVRDAG